MDNGRAEGKCPLGMPDRHEGKLDDRQDSAQWKVVGVIARVVLMRMGMDACGFCLHGQVVLAVIRARFADVPAGAGMAMRYLAVRVGQRIHELHAEYEDHQDGRDQAWVNAISFQGLSQQSGSAIDVRISLRRTSSIPLQVQ
jgi:hypothetical protein